MIILSLFGCDMFAIFVQPFPLLVICELRVDVGALSWLTLAICKLRVDAGALSLSKFARPIVQFQTVVRVRL